jgi:glycosyltransferase involved in cell wall biosynthesis
MVTFITTQALYSKEMISIAVPAYNEGGSIGQLLEELSKFEAIQIVIAEDASTDGTREVAQEFSSEHEMVKLTSSDIRTGKGAAIKRALKLADGEVLGFIDADMSIHPRDFMTLVSAIDGGADLAIGSRRLPKSIITGRQTFMRELFGTAYIALTRFILNINVSDFQCGCKAFRRELWEDLDIRCDGFAFDTELISKAYIRGFKIAEVPITWNNKTNSRVNTLRDSIDMFRSLLKIRREIRGLTSKRFDF